VSLFVYLSGSMQLYLLVYVDDILVMWSDSVCVPSLVSKMALEFKVLDMGSPSFFLGIDTVFVSGGMLLSQQRYMTDKDLVSVEI